MNAFNFLAFANCSCACSQSQTGHKLRFVFKAAEADPNGGFLRGHGTYLETHPADHPLVMEMDRDNSNVNPMMKNRLMASTHRKASFLPPSEPLNEPIN